MDNCSIHKNNLELEALITAAGARIIYLPPYSPDFSPIENCWSKIKSILRRTGARTYPDLLKALETAFTEVTKKDFLGWFTHCCYCAEHEIDTLLQFYPLIQNEVDRKSVFNIKQV
jgi:transposase